MLNFILYTQWSQYWAVLVLSAVCKRDWSTPVLSAQLSTSPQTTQAERLLRKGVSGQFGVGALNRLKKFKACYLEENLIKYELLNDWIYEISIESAEKLMICICINNLIKKQEWVRKEKSNGFWLDLFFNQTLIRSIVSIFTV